MPPDNVRECLVRYTEWLVKHHGLDLYDAECKTVPGAQVVDEYLAGECE